MDFSPTQQKTDVLQSPDIFPSNVRCKLEDKLKDARDSIKEESMVVYARIRPMLPHEISKEYKECIGVVDECTVRTLVPVTSAKFKNSRQNEEIIEDFSFSSVFGPETGQFVFFRDTMLRSIESFVEGGNRFIFSYGITGSGKTYTLQGDSENPGMIPLSMKLYFASIKKQLLEEIKVKPCRYNSIIALSPDEQKQEYLKKKEILSLYNEDCENVPGSFRQSNNKTFAMTLCDMFSGIYETEGRQTTLPPDEMAAAQAACVMKEAVEKCAENQHGLINVWVSFIEIYNENLYDLLQPVTRERKTLKLRECDGNFYVAGAREVCISDAEEALKILNIGRKNLSIASTKMNYQSSRSHCIFTLRVVRVPDKDNLSYGKVNRLSFCDLAGSERNSKTQATGVRQKEAGAINTSLLVLGRCLEQLRMNQMGKDQRIPFRESKLTGIFSAFFLGKAKAIMIANVSPVDYTFDETLHVLKFSALARKLKVYDTFLSDATSTLQNICNNWTDISNASIRNDSMESDVSDSEEIIQQKDAIIEKLLDLAQRLIDKQGQDTMELEMKIRRDVMEEYSTYSDHLLREKEKFHQEQMNKVREHYTKQLAKRDQMYEKIIEEYRENETSGSSEDSDSETSLRESENLKSSEEVAENSSSPKKRLNLTEIATQTDFPPFEKTELENLQSTLASVTADLEKSKQEHIESLKLTTNLDLEIEAYQNEIITLKKNVSEASETAKKITEDCEAKVQDLEQIITSLKEKLIASNAVLEKIAHHSEDLMSELEIKETPKIDLTEMLKNPKELSEIFKSYQLVTKKFKENISDLQLELQVTSKNVDLVKKEMKVRETVSVQLEKEIDTFKQEIEALNLKLFEKEEKEAKFASVTHELEVTKENYEQICALLQELEKNISTTTDTDKDEKIESSFKELSKTHAFAVKTIENLKEKLLLLQQEVQKVNEEASFMKIELENKHVSNELQEEIDTYKQEIERLNLKLSEKEEMESKFESVSDELELAKGNYVQICILLQDLENCINTNANTDEQKKINFNGLSETHSFAMNFIQNLKKKICSLQQEIEKANKNVTSIKIEMENKQPLLEDLRENIEEKTKQINCLISEKQKLEEELTVSKKELDEEKNNIEVKNSKLQEFERKHNEFEAEVQRLEQQLKANSEKLILVNKELEAVRLELQQKTVKLQTFENQHEEFKDEIKKLTQQLQAKESELSETLLPVGKELEDLKDQLQSKILKLQELENDIEEKTKQINCLVTEKNKFEEELTLSKKELEEEKNNIEVKNSKLQEFERKHEEYDNEIKKLKLQLQVKEELSEESLPGHKELENVKCELQQKTLKLQILENQCKEYEDEIHKIKGQLQTNEEEKLLINKELENVKCETQQKTSKLQALENQCKEYEDEIYKLEQQAKEESSEKILVNEKLENLKSEMKQKTLRIQELENKHKDSEFEVQELKQQLEVIKSEMEHKALRLQELENQHKDYEREIEESKQQLEAKEGLSEKLLSVSKQLEVNKFKMEQKTLKLQELENQNKNYESEIHNLKKLNETQNKNIKEKDVVIQEKITKINELEKRILELHALIDNLEKMSLTAAERIKDLATTVVKYETENSDLLSQIKNKEASIEQLEKALCDTQAQLKNRQISFKKKLHSEKEQHEIEITETIKLKHLVEEENMSLKLSSPEPKTIGKKADSKKEHLQKNETNQKGKENFPRNFAIRSLRNKEMNLKELSFSDIKASTPDLSKQKNRKRLSDEDFKPGGERAAKKMKPAPSKLPVKRTSRRKLQEKPEENASPLKKIANAVSSRVKAVSASISSQAAAASPRLTRGRKKLFNPELPSSSTASKGKKK